MTDKQPAATLRSLLIIYWHCYIFLVAPFPGFTLIGRLLLLGTSQERYLDDKFLGVVDLEMIFYSSQI